MAINLHLNSFLTCDATTRLPKKLFNLLIFAVLSRVVNQFDINPYVLWMKTYIQITVLSNKYDIAKKSNFPSYTYLQLSAELNLIRPFTVVKHPF